MTRRADELRAGIERAQERQRFAERQLAQFDANNPENGEASERTRRKLAAAVQLAQNDQEILKRSLVEAVETA